MSKISDQVGTLLGRSPLSGEEVAKVDLLATWVAARITKRAAALGVTVVSEDAQQVVVKAIARQMDAATRATQETIQVDDGQVTRQYARPKTVELGEPEIDEAWWDDLGLSTEDTGAFTVRLAYRPPAPMHGCPDVHW